MNVKLYERALDQVALRYAQLIRAAEVEISPSELAAVVENNWPKIVAEAMAIYKRVAAADVDEAEQALDRLQPAA